MKVSIVTPVYNAEAFLRKTIESVIKQTYSNFELLLVDDGSTDESGLIVDEYSKKDKRIVAIHQNNSGVSSARNTALKNATGEWVCFLDSDDEEHLHGWIRMLLPLMKEPISYFKVRIY